MDGSKVTGRFIYLWNLDKKKEIARKGNKPGSAEEDKKGLNC
jgi:hypothetical protein